MARAWAFLKVFFRVRDDPLGGDMKLRDKAREWKPDRKHAGEAATLIAVWGAGVFGLDVPAEVAGAAIFLTGYLIPNPS